MNKKFLSQRLNVNLTSNKFRSESFYRVKIGNRFFHKQEMFVKTSNKKAMGEYGNSKEFFYSQCVTVDKI